MSHTVSSINLCKTKQLVQPAQEAKEPWKKGKIVLERFLFRKWVSWLHKLFFSDKRKVFQAINNAHSGFTAHWHLLRVRLMPQFCFDKSLLLSCHLPSNRHHNHLRPHHWGLSALPKETLPIKSFQIIFLINSLWKRGNYEWAWLKTGSWSMVIRMCAPPIKFSSARGQLGRMLRLSGFIITPRPLIISPPPYNLSPPIISSLREQLGMSCPPPVKDGRTRSHLAASTREHLGAPGRVRVLAKTAQRKRQRVN